eukprot:1001704-Rhodomonas_salina.1
MKERHSLPTLPAPGPTTHHPPPPHQPSPNATAAFIRRVSALRCHSPMRGMRAPSRRSCLDVPDLDEPVEGGRDDLA